VEECERHRGMSEGVRRVCLSVGIISDSFLFLFWVWIDA
jgi:hypothetical protein